MIHSQKTTSYSALSEQDSDFATEVDIFYRSVLRTMMKTPAYKSTKTTGLSTVMLDVDAITSQKLSLNLDLKRMIQPCQCLGCRGIRPW